MRLVGIFGVRRPFLFGVALSCAWASLLQAQDPSSTGNPLSERERVIHLLSRTTYGVRPQDVDAVLGIGRTAWLERQMKPDVSEPELPQAGGLLEGIAFVATAAAPLGADSARPQLRLPRRIVLRTGGQANTAAVGMKLVRALGSERQLEQVLTDFWLNHFNVYVGKRDVSRAIPGYEDKIRVHVFGRFRDLLGEVARHPAMLIYLDNYLNGLPPADSAAGGSSLNENYARELLELHTLGVDGGYTQRDVVEVARAFTGWSVPFSRNLRTAQITVTAQTFRFQEAWHDTGEKFVLGRTLPAGRGTEDGEDVLDLLASHPATARHLATKLARHFVADDPPEEIVEALARVFRETDGDLAAVTRALFTDERFYARSHYRAKVKRPWEFLVSALRVTGAELGPTSVATLQSHLGLLRHAPYGEPAPTGYPSTADRWVSTGAAVDRMNLAVQIGTSSLEYAGTATLQGMTLAPEPPAAPPLSIDPWEVLTGVPQGLRPAAEVFGGFGAGGTSIQVMALLERMAPGAPTDALRASIMQDLSRHPPGTEAEVLLRRAIAIALGSPEFQRY